MDLFFHPQASKDAREIAREYAGISEKLVTRFWAELDAAIEVIANHPERHHYDPSGLRRSNLKTFPFHVLFEEGLESTRIIVIRHHHRNPTYGTKRV